MDMSNDYIFLSRFFHHVGSFVLLFIWLFIIKKSCLSVYWETTTYSTAMCEEREFNYLFYGIAQVQIG